MSLTETCDLDKVQRAGDFACHSFARDHSYEYLLTDIRGMFVTTHPVLGQRRRRWPNINPTLGQLPVFAGKVGNLENFRHCPNVGLMLVNRLRDWHNIKPALAQRLLFAENHSNIEQLRHVSFTFHAFTVYFLLLFFPPGKFTMSKMSYSQGVR